MNKKPFCKSTNLLEPKHCVNNVNCWIWWSQMQFYWWREADPVKRIFATVKSIIDTDNSSNTVLLNFLFFWNSLNVYTLVWKHTNKWRNTKISFQGRHFNYFSVLLYIWHVGFHIFKILVFCIRNIYLGNTQIIVILMWFIFFEIEAYTKPNNVWSLHFKREVFIWCHVVYVPESFNNISRNFNLCDF
jgi:hypothetical protein